MSPVPPRVPQEAHAAPAASDDHSLSRPTAAGRLPGRSGGAFLAGLRICGGRGTAPAVRRRSRRRRDDCGLTTLEWLLIVAAVAGLAALAVVLVTGVVGGTSERIADSSARHVAASLAAAEIVDESKAPNGIDPDWNTWEKWEEHFTQKCNQLAILYGDAGVAVTPDFKRPLAETRSPGSRPITTSGLLGQASGAGQTRLSQNPHAACEVG